MELAEELNNIEKDVSNKKLTNKDGALKIIASLYEEKYGNFLFRLDRDSQYDFYLKMYPTLCRSFSLYDKTRSLFSTYIFTVLEQNAKSYIRIVLKNNAKEKSYCRCVAEQQEESMIAEDCPCYEINENIFQNKTIMIKKDKRYSRRERLLILALKSAFYLTEEHIKKLATETGFSENELWDYKNFLEKGISKKIEARNKAICIRNTIYFRKNKYEIELESMRKSEHDTTTSYQYTKIQKSLETLTQRWHTIVAKGTYTKRVVPSNKEIAKLLNIPETRVFRILKQSLSEISWKD